MKCLSKSCSCDVLVGRGYCLRHGGPERFEAEKIRQNRAESQLRGKRNDSRPRKAHPRMGFGVGIRGQVIGPSSFLVSLAKRNLGNSFPGL